MSFYDDPENIKMYIKMCEGYDGLNIYESLNKHLPIKSTLLELGSGAGLDIEYLKINYLVTGSDLSDEFLKICKNKYPDISFIKLNALNLKVSDKYDCIYSNKVLHHLTETELKQSLYKQKKILTSNGLIAHSFWLGAEDKEMNGLLFTYYNKKHLLNILSESFEVLSTLSYKEFDEDDSIFIIAKLKSNHV